MFALHVNQNGRKITLDNNFSLTETLMCSIYFFTTITKFAYNTNIKAPPTMARAPMLPATDIFIAPFSWVGPLFVAFELTMTVLVTSAEAVDVEVVVPTMDV